MICEGFLDSVGNAYRNVIKIGYTNYWRLDISNTNQEFVDSIWDNFTYEVRLLFDYNHEEYIKDLVINEDVIRFDGQCETFLFERKMRHHNFFDKSGEYTIYCFCKTNRQPYDKFVKAVLLIARKHYGSNKLKISCDDMIHEDQVIELSPTLKSWKEALSLVNSLKEMKRSEVTGMKDSGHKLAVNDGRQFDNFGYIQ